MPLPSFIFDSNQDTPESLARRRALAEAMLQRGTSGIASNPWEGLAQLGQALAGRVAMSGVKKAETKHKTAAYDMLQKALMGGGQARSPNATSSPMAGGDLRSGILATAKAVGIPPEDLATAMSYETAGTFDPAKKGPTTKWGQHKGLIQFGEPQAKQYGVDWNDPINSQLGENGAVARYLKDAGVKPGMGLMDVYSAINAGRVGRYNASDAAAGGAPGTVADKVNNQMAGHRAKALALLNGGAQQAMPVSAPSQAMPPPPSPKPMGMAFNGPPQPPSMMAAQPPQQPQVMPTAAAPPQQAPMAPQQPMTAYQRMVQTSLGKDGGLDDPRNRAIAQQAGLRTGGAPMAPSPMQAVQQGPLAQQSPMAGGSRLEALRNFLFSPNAEWIGPAQRDILIDEYKRELESAQPPDPMKQLQLEKLQLDVEQQRNPKIDPSKELDLKIKQLEFQQMQQPDPLKAMQIEKMKAEVEQMRNAKPKPAIEDPLKVGKAFESQEGQSRIKAIAPTIESMYRSLTDPSAMADLDFVYGLAKILDPTSVVRESEGRMVLDAQGIGPQLLGTLNKIVSGDQAMDSKTRANLFSVAVRRAQELQKQAQTERGVFEGIASANQIDPNIYLQQVPSLPKWERQTVPQLQPPANPAPAVQPVPSPNVDALKPVQQGKGDASVPPAPSGWENEWPFLSPEERQQVLQQVSPK